MIYKVGYHCTVKVLKKIYQKKKKSIQVVTRIKTRPAGGSQREFPLVKILPTT